MKVNSNQLNEFINYSGLYRDKVAHSENYLFLETIESRSKNFDWKVLPHFHSSLYQIFVAEKGSATLYTSEGKVRIEAPFIAFIPPLNIHGFDFDENIQGRILTFSDFYTGTLLEKHPRILGTLDRIFWLTVTDFPTTFSEFTDTFNRINSEYHSHEEDKEMLLEYELYLLVLQFYRFAHHHLNQTAEGNNRMSYFRKFQQMVKMSDNPFTSLEVYAKHLNITTKHLNRICRSVKHMSALQVVQEELVLKAKAHLYHFTTNISEIAYELGFDDPSYFTRLFKKHTGLTPNEYRKKISLAKMSDTTGEPVVYAETKL